MQVLWSFWGYHSLLVFLHVGLTACQATGFDIGTFQQPSIHSRPKFRYWLPDASVDAAQVKADIASAISIGAGGVELVPYYNYGGTFGSAPAGVNWTETGFGTPSFRRVLKAALESHKETGALMDFALGPNQGQGVPAQASDEGLQWDLVPFSDMLPQNGVYNQVLPGWGSGKLIAAVTARVVFNETRTADNDHMSGSPVNATWSFLVLDNQELKEVTSEISKSTGHANLTLPSTNGSDYYRIFAFYETKPLHKNLEYSSGLNSSIWDNGSYVVDHFSARGAQVTIDFWEKNILVDDLKGLVKEAGNLVWEDSNEVPSHINWTPSIPDQFYARYQYSLTKYLPLLIFRQNNLLQQREAPGEFQCVLNTEDQGRGFINDYRSVLEDDYNEYLRTLANWANNELGLKFSTQPTYNLPMDMAAAIPLVDVPEGETFSQMDIIDSYREFTGPAFLSGKRILSSEMGAKPTKAYSYTLSDLLFSMNRAFVGGVNQLVLHGQTYSGKYPQTTWPGYTTFSYLFSEVYSPKQPSWNLTLPDVLSYAARAQWVLQHGVPRTDVVILRSHVATDWTWRTIYNHTDLEDNGWTYNYISPSNFGLPQAFAKDGILSPDTLAWKAIVIESKENFTTAEITHVQQFAQAGVSVILSGGLPGLYTSGNQTFDNQFINEMKTLIALETVHQVESNKVSEKLYELGLSPRIQAISSTKIYTLWREDAETNRDFAFILNDSLNDTVGELVVATGKTPYWLDLWSGEEKPVLTYQVTNGKTKIPLRLRANQTALLAFGPPGSVNASVPTCHLNSTSEDILGYRFTTPDTISLHLNHVSEVTTSDGKTLQVGRCGVRPPIELRNWTLSVEHWEKPADIYDSGAEPLKRNTTQPLPILTSWSDIPALVNVSGVGHYATTFSWQGSQGENSTSGAYIRLPHVLHGARVLVNGYTVPTADYYGEQRDITSLLTEGDNEVLISTPSTMWNYLSTFYGEIEMSGGKPFLNPAAAPKTSNGLVGDVAIVPFREELVQCGST
ncbi:uncharacterized protein CTRU02_212697 [Colletotrichum truncatum]|uniref:Uncharacterized protein n=1 Tax=Colletotrichum truncatum TaxID=5467 RepID=A0ACC3YIK2_COLTU|nr:uncharacterized protein CTRU02_05230 [Colletotrichum truncatum]KAF6794398.1 hypothetical protein CTRU02_05230 [Colletotrichum truncatum]